ncbi:SusC/RagA family TonB-linked outer membrane protein [Chitinophagaceae bacterium LWZ2-11]
MKKNKLTALCCLFLACGVSLFLPGQAQQVLQALEIKGVVKNTSTGSAIAGATVELASAKGVTTVTDASGNFTLKIPASKNSGALELLITSMGFEKQSLTLQPGQKEVIIELKEGNAAVLNEVVVTALGVKKDKKALAYSVTEVKGSEFTQAREINLADALTGKVAGVNASSLASGPGGSSRVIIRGNGSLNGDNQPLYVVNGMPIDNTTQSTVASGNGAIGLNTDRGDGIAGINADDIESITVLKGGTAAALYGSRASNGVILITTKKGVKQKGIGLDFNSTYTIETPSIIPDWQYEYGAGQYGVKPASQAEAIAMGRLSFGAKMDGSPVVQFDGVSRPYSPQKNNIKNFYNTGSTFTNTVAFSGGSDAVTYRASLSDLNNHGLVPNQTLDKKIASISLNATLSKKLSFEGYAQYNLEKAVNRSGVADAPGNPNWGTYMIANTVDVRKLAPGYDASGNEVLWNPSGFASNPYFVVNKFQNNDERNRFIGNASIKYNILDNFFIKGRVSQDYTTLNYTGVVPTGAAYAPTGFYQQYTSSTTETNGELTLNYSTKLARDLTFNVMAGGNQRRSKYQTVNLDGSQFYLPNFYDPSNLANLTTTNVLQRTATNSIFGSADFGYKDMLFVTVTGRSDWFSTLSVQNNQIFYPSVGGSFILSKALKLPDFINFTKLRAAWAQVGGATPSPYALNLTYSLVPGGGQAGQPLEMVTNYGGANSGLYQVPNSGLKPLTSTTYEFGFEAKLFHNRVGVDFAWYNRKTTNDIVQASISPGSGYNYALLNVGEVSNKGVELLLTATAIKTKNFSWDVSYNMGYNKNTVVKLANGLTSLQMDVSVNNYAYIYNEVGQSYSMIKGYKVKKDAQGRTVYNANGTEQATGLTDLGSGVSPFTTGITNSFNYKRFSFSFLIDGKFGGKVYSATNLYATRFGLNKITLPGRDNGLTVSGVDANGQPFTKTIAPSGLQAYYDNYKNLSEKFVYDADFIKLRQVIIGYSIPVNNIKFVKLQSLSVSFVARNLFLLYKKAPNIDPESTFSNSNAQGFEMFGVPRTRNFGLNLMVKF